MSTINDSDKFKYLFSVIARLRSNDGCPWDIKQTPESIRKYLLEETQELAEAIDLGNPNDIRDEIGDLLFILIMLILMHDEQGKFTADEVFEAITAKMIRRHPHVFSGKNTGTEDELRRQWQEIKQREKK